MNLIDEVLDRLEADSSLNERQQDLVLASLTGEVASVLEGVEASRPKRVPAEQGDPRGAWLRSIQVEGFRGIGQSVTLGLTAGPGLHVICGRNGSGKSSFSEALELLLTESCSRWVGRSKAWRDGWQNLHHRGGTSIVAEIALDGHPGAVRIEAAWDMGVDPDARRVDRVTGSNGLAGRADLGWSRGLETWRPFLSYNELGSLLEGSPADLHDTLAAVLGLEPLAEAFGRLETARKDVARIPKTAKQELEVIRRRLQDVDDDRARFCLDALPTGRKWKLDGVGDLLSGAGPHAPAAERLRYLASLRPLEPERLETVVVELHSAASEVRAAQEDRDAAASLRLATLLERAVAWFDASGDEARNCPVCSTQEILDVHWRDEARAKAEGLRAAAQRVERAQQRAESSRAAARSLVAAVLDLSATDEALVGETVRDAREAWRRFRTLPESEDLEEWGSHLALEGSRVIGGVEAVRKAARDLQDERNEVWRPVAEALRRWLPEAMRAQRATGDGNDLKAAADWLSAVEEEMRNRRLEPIKDNARGIWELLRARSNVSLDDLRFTGSRTRRRVEMDVSVDGNPGVALGVMSQGELHSLALSLFIPRATRQESPFRFLLIDDPVQAMDPVKVEGLARVLEGVAATHQVVVFSHDDRLSEAIRRLGISARVHEVHRKPGSVVEVRNSLDPVSRLFADAHALVRDERLPAEVRDRVVPGLCRQALEARALEVARARRLGRGEAHAAVEELLAESRSFVQSMALAFFDDPNRAGEVYGRLDANPKSFGPTASELVRECNRGSHGGAAGAGVDFVKAAQKLDSALERLA